jgi:uracil-DNA glycosylase
MLPSNVVELKIFSCPLQMEMECSQRLDCKPIPGAGSNQPKYFVVGLNPGVRGGVWRQYKSLKKLKIRYIQECFAPIHEYGKFLRQLEDIIPDFRIPRTVYLTDIVKCPTVRNENPSESMVKKCYSAYWENMVQTFNPDYIIGLGSKVAKIIGGFNRNGNKVLSDRIAIGNKNYWFISAPHPRYKTVYQLKTITLEIKSVLDNPEKHEIKKKIPSSKKDISLRRAEIEKQLADLGYQKQNGRISRGDRIVNLVVSKDFGVRTRIY